ncbi:tight adherence pilus pseudopilin TadF [Marinomonas ostreistagni]|uniref:ATP-binding protein n=1 Tax=Marinomonas ostreistagni TaxID=359209 RepID=A0ABS0ZCV8_9GAMM|nr:tight adherence pilus pseudopilin TadF [Marinomonas ostreistagni]MBJ7551486.1 hypothetical protein [Marinomonas ostreistagni]
MKQVQRYSHRRPHRLKGNFLVEFSIVGLVFAAALSFASDTMISFSVKGKLDRLAYSGVGLLKERTALFGSNQLTVSDAEFQQLDTILQNSLTRMLSSFDTTKYGIRLETWDPDAGYSSRDRGQITCTQSDLDLSSDLSVMTSWGREASLYRITLCYETPNWFGRFVTNDDTVVRSDALMIGR